MVEENRETLKEEDLQKCVNNLPIFTKEKIMKKYRDKVIIAGGYIRDTINNDPIKDIDIFFKDPNIINEIVMYPRINSGAFLMQS